MGDRYVKNYQSHSLVISFPGEGEGSKQDPYPSHVGSLKTNSLLVLCSIILTILSPCKSITRTREQKNEKQK